MKLDSTAAAYGLIQVVFADVTERLAYALFTLRRRREPEISFPEIFKWEFSRIVKALKSELAQFEGQQSDALALKAVRDACCHAGALSKWRNRRIHARVRPVEDGLALYNSKTGERLSISDVDCQRILEGLVNVIVTLETYFPDLIRSHDFEQEFEAFFKEHFSESDGENSLQ